MKKIFFFLLFCFPLFLFAQKNLLQSGPMVGYSEMMEVQLWAQTTEKAKVQFKYWPIDNMEDIHFTEKVNTYKITGYVAKVIADEVLPGKKYNYTLMINNEEVSLNYPTEFQSQVLWQYRTDPPPFSIAVGSCAYVNETEYDRPGSPYGSNYQIFESIHEDRPDAMLWLGDNTYLREVDWYSKTGVIHRYTHTRSLPEMQPLLASTHHYAIWDDHDFGPNDSDRSFIHKDLTREVFNNFWCNPTSGIKGEGITTQFQWADIDFFLLDNRTFRAPNYLKEGEKPLLGKEQIDWLIDALVKSRAPFKLIAIGGQVLNSAPVYENYIHHHEKERTYLLKRIQEEDIKGVVFLTGDRHLTELSEMTTPTGLKIFDLTVSPFTSGPATKVTENNENLVDGTLVLQHNYGILNFSGSQKDRQMEINIYDANGDMLWQKTIKASEWYKK